MLDRIFNKIASFFVKEKYKEAQEILIERRDAEKRFEQILDRLEDRENRYRTEFEYRNALLLAIPDIVFIHSTDGYYLDCYAQQEKNLIYPCEQVVSKHISECMPTVLAQEAIERFKRVAETRESEKFVYILNINEEEKHFEARIVPISDDRVLSIIRDITDWVHAQHNIAKQLLLQQKTLHECEEEITNKNKNTMGGLMYKELVEQLRLHEGERLHAYKCTENKTTIGVGRNIDKNGGKGITKDESNFLLMNDIAECVTDLQTIFHNFDLIDEKRKIALIDLRFNLGGAGFRSFRKMISAIKRRDWTTAADEALDSRWSTQVQKSRVDTIISQLRGYK